MLDSRGLKPQCSDSLKNRDWLPHVVPIYFRNSTCGCLLKLSHPQFFDQVLTETEISRLHRLSQGAPEASGLVPHVVNVIAEQSLHGIDFGNRRTVTDLMDITLEFVDPSTSEKLDALWVGREFRIDVYAQDMRIDGAGEGVTGAYIDVEFNDVIDVTQIVHGFTQLRTGTISAELIDEVGGFQSQGQAGRARQRVFSLLATAKAEGELILTTNDGDHPDSMNTLHLMDGAVDDRTSHGSARIDIGGLPELAITKFDAHSDQLTAGGTTVFVEVE
ncbi:MAG: hypothetical protein O3A00_14800, partial [Planctomycetota bacterium]|nr:hypothetical protein [Planctomycetota bacterium]